MVETNRNIETASRPLHSSWYHFKNIKFLFLILKTETKIQSERPSPLTNQAQKVEKRQSLVKQLSGRHVLTLGLAGVPVHVKKPKMKS